MSNLAIAVAFLTLSAAHAADLEWGPYLQDVRAGRTTILWTTRGGSGVGAVRYFSSSGPVDVASTVTALPASLTDLPQDIWLHRAVLRGLDAGTEYRYVVLIDGKEAAADPSQRFATAGSGPFRFLVIGDTGDNGAGQRELAQPLLREAAAFLLHAGDIAYWDGTFQQYQAAYFGIYGTLLARMAVFPAPGNHDISNGALAYRTIFDPPQDNVPAIARNLYYSFDWANAHFTVLDSNQPLTAGSPMLSWLEQDLTQTSQTWRIVAIHHPPFTSTPNKRDDPICKLVLKELTPVFERHGVHLVISGHEHIYQRTQPRLTGVWMPRGPGVVYVTSGGGGSQNYEPGKEPFLAASAGGPHYLRIDVTESALQVEAVDSAAKVLDRWELKAAPELAEFGVVDAAAFSRQIAPGGLVSIFGWNLSGATVRDTLRPWPVLYAGRAQINAQVPFEIEDRATLSVTTGRGIVTAPILVTAIAPNIFTV